MKRLLTLLIALVLLFPSAALAALERGQVINADPSLYEHIDLKQPYTVNMYLVGDNHPGTDAVVAEINAILEKDYNTKLEVTFLSWADYETMYGLVLAGGEKVDLIYTATWCFMYTEAAKGSFYKMDEEFIKTYMPLTWEYQAKDSWSETYIGGAYVAVPCNMMVPQSKYVAIRDDLREKYELAPLKNWEDYMNYALTIAEKETPESGIYALASDSHNREMWRTYYQQYNAVPVHNEDDFMYLYHEGGGLPEAEEIKFVYETDMFRAFCKDAKVLADAGAWSRSALTNTISTHESFANLQAASTFWNGSVFSYMQRAEKNEGIVCAAYDLTGENIVLPEAYSNSDMAITASCQNPQRAAMVLDLLGYDFTLNNLVCLGIEGESWIDNGDFTYSRGPNWDNYPTIGNAAAWWAKNDNWESVYADLRNKVIDDDLKKRMVPNPTITFIFDETPVKANMAAVNAVKSEYYGILTLGLVDDVDAAIDEMIQKAYDSGLQTIYDEMYKQYDAWKETRQQ